MDTKELIRHQSRSNVEKMRSSHEVLARYNLNCQQYKDLKNNASGNNREHLLMIYTELKLLGWVLGKSEAVIVRDANA